MLKRARYYHLLARKKHRFHIFCSDFVNIYKKTLDVPLPRKVAAFCRVSTNQEIQHHSLAVQREYFKKLIEEKLNWIFIDIYADEVSGRNNLHTKEFQRMMADCRTGRIDYIIVKSISRLGGIP